MNYRLAQGQLMGNAGKSPGAPRQAGKLEKDEKILRSEHELKLSHSIFWNLEYGTLEFKLQDQLEVGKCIEPASPGPAALVAGQRLVIALPRV